MAVIKVVGIWLALVLAWYLIRDYMDRMQEVNANACRIYGYMPDCKTKLK